MHKKLSVGKLENLHKKSLSANPSAQVIAFKHGEKVVLQNFEIVGGDIKVDGDQLVIRIPVREGDVVVLEDQRGMVEKKIL